MLCSKPNNILHCCSLVILPLSSTSVRAWITVCVQTFGPSSSSRSFCAAALQLLHALVPQNFVHRVFFLLLASSMEPQVKSNCEWSAASACKTDGTNKHWHFIFVYVVSNICNSQVGGTKIPPLGRNSETDATRKKLHSCSVSRKHQSGFRHWFVCM